VSPLTSSHRCPAIQATSLAILISGLLALVKGAIGLTSGSLALLSSAIDSCLDLLLSLCNYLALRQSRKPADARHPYGHGKFETLATFGQSLVIGATGLAIMTEAGKRLYQPPMMLDNQWLNIGLAVLTLNLVAAALLSRHLRRVGHQLESSALQADALHYATDVYSNLALLIGLSCAQLFDLAWMDPLLSLLVGGYILRAAWPLLRGCLDEFLDVRLPEEQLQQVRRCIEGFRPRITGYHHLRSRRTGRRKMIDFHLNVCRFKTIQEAHDLADQIERAIQRQLPMADVTIHVEPTDCAQCGQCADCQLTCERRPGPRHNTRAATGDRPGT